MDLPVGEVISGRFRIGELVGAGGMGIVYRALDLHTNEAVALKLLRADIPDGAARFGREAMALARLSHPHVVRYVAHGTHGRAHFLAMEWLEGEELSRRLRAGPLPVAQALAMGIALADALGHAHAHGVVHRDVKPSNVLLAGAEVARAKLVDFGLALVPDQSDFRTQLGTLLGTAGFLAPEQARGQHDVGPRADVFSLGCVLYKCLTGQGPFAGGDAVASLAKLLLDEPAPMAAALSVPSELDQLVLEMLAKDPAGRPADGATVAERLRAVSPIVLEAIPDPPPSLTGRERRVVSVVVAARGRLGDDERTLAPVAALEVEGTALRAAAELAGARVDHVPGAIVATLFGQGSATDQAARAAKLALAMRPLVGDVPLTLATGRAEVSGRAAVGEAIDRAVERAVSLEPGVAPVGAVWIDAVTAGLLGPEFVVEPILPPARDRERDAEERAEGRAEGEGEGAWLLPGGHARPEGLRTLLGKETPCVGRERELANLDAIQTECEQDGVTRALVVLAPAGIGKSRLRHEWLRTLARRAHPPDVWLARAEPMAIDSPFAVLRRCVRDVIGVQGHDDDASLATSRRKVRTRVEAALPAGAEVDRVAEFLGELCGVPMADAPSVQLRAARRDPILMGDQFRRAWEEWVTAEVLRHPVVIVLEDVHWADRSSVQFVEHAMRRVTGGSLFVVALARPEVDERFPELWAGRAQRMELAPLGQRAGAALVRSVLADAAPDVVDRIVARAEGNAFFLEEIVRAVAEGRGEDVPETVLAMVQRRVEGLEPEARRVLRAAAVFGETFFEQGVAALLGDDGTKAGAWLAALAEQELVGRRDRSRLAHQREWVFRHALVREGAYAMLTDADRALGHRLVAEWLEKNGEPDSAALAKHFEIGQRPANAAAHYLAAAKQALGGSDLGAVIDRVDACVACIEASGAPDTAMMGDAFRLRAEALRWTGRLADAEQSARRAVSLLRPGSRTWFTSCAELATAASGLGHAEVLLSVHDLVVSPEAQPGATTEATTAGTSPIEIVAARVVALGRIAGQLYTVGKRDAADALVAAADLARSETLGGSYPEAAARVEQARAYRALYSSDIGTYYDRMRASSELYTRAGDRRNACVQAANMGYVAVVAGAFDEAEEALVPPLRLAESLGMLRIQAIFKQNIGLLRLWQGRVDESLALQREAIAAFDAQGDVRLSVFSRCYMASALAASGDLPAAKQVALEAVGMSETMLPAHASALTTLADIELQLGAPVPALEHSGQAYELLERLQGLEDNESLVRITYIDALAANGRQAEGSELLRVALDTLHARAAKVKRADWRESFRRNVPDNRRIYERAAQWGVKSVDEA